MSAFFTHLLFVLRKNFLKILIFSILFVAAACLVFYVISFRTASAILTFKYPNASDGLYPNGTYLNAYYIFTPEILEKAISNAGLQGFVNPEEIDDGLAIRPRSTADLITTQFNVTFTQGKDVNLGVVSASEMLKSVLYAYIDFFHATYSSDQLALELDLVEKESLEYSDIIDYYNIYLNQLRKYLMSQQENNKDYVSSDGTSFQDLINIVEQYRLTALREVEAIVSERGVTNDKEAFLDRVKYRLWNLTNQYNYNRQMQQLYNDIIRSYEARLTGVVFIPSLDSNRNFYMSKSKVGIDLYTTKSTEYEELAEDVQREINQLNQYVLMITREETAAKDAENIARVDALLDEFRTQLSATMEEIKRVEKEYSQYKNHSYITVKTNEPGLIKRTNAKMVVIITAIIDAVILVVLAIRHQNRKDKEASN